MLQCVAVCCNVLHCIAVKCHVLTIYKRAATPNTVQPTRTLQYAAVYCSVLQYFAVFCNVLHCVAAWCHVPNIYKRAATPKTVQPTSMLQYVAVYAVCCSVLQCVAVCWIVSQCAAVCCGVVPRANHKQEGSNTTCCTTHKHVAVWSSVLQCVAACCSVLQCVAVWCHMLTIYKRAATPNAVQPTSAGSLAASEFATSPPSADPVCDATISPINESWQN